MRSMFVGIIASGFVTVPAYAEAPDLEITYQFVQQSGAANQASITALVISKDSGHGWSCVFVFDTGVEVSAKEASCHSLKYKGADLGGLTAVSSSGNSLPLFPFFVAVDKSGRYASACLVSRVDQNSVPTVCSTAPLE